jgi:DNA-binding MarR family transcriptional regulator
MIEDRKPTECGDCLCLASRRAARSITRLFDRKMRASGLRATQFSILAMLTLTGPTSIGHLAEGLGMERTTLTRNLALIEAQRWVTIQPGDDARARIVSVTSKGRAAVEAALPAWRQAQASAAAAIGQSGVAALRALSRKFTH